MCTRLSIQVSSPLQSHTLETEFLCNEAWNADSEALLFQRVHEILSLIRSEGTSLKFHLEVEVADPGEAMFLIKKNLNHQTNHSIQQHKLSLREIEVLDLVMQGFTNPEIASKL